MQQEAQQSPAGEQHSPRLLAVGLLKDPLPLVISSDVTVQPGQPPVIRRRENGIEKSLNVFARGAVDVLGSLQDPHQSDSRIGLDPDEIELPLAPFDIQSGWGSSRQMRAAVTRNVRRSTYGTFIECRVAPGTNVLVTGYQSLVAISGELGDVDVVSTPVVAVRTVAPDPDRPRAGQRTRMLDVGFAMVLSDDGRWVDMTRVSEGWVDQNKELPGRVTADHVQHLSAFMGHGDANVRHVPELLQLNFAGNGYASVDGAKLVRLIDQSVSVSRRTHDLNNVERLRLEGANAGLTGETKLIHNIGGSFDVSRCELTGAARELSPRTGFLPLAYGVDFDNRVLAEFEAVKLEIGEQAEAQRAADDSAGLTL